MYDFIGDIHGHADELELLLKKLGYFLKNGTYSHNSRKAFFIGDFIDRGPKIRETLQIVKSMVDNNKAIAIIGNHEYNSLCFHYQNKDGGHLRKHTIKNIIQHYKTLEQFQNLQDEYEYYLEWFKTLPLYYETENFRAVHAYWNNENINFLRSVLDNDRLTDEIIYESVRKNSKLHLALEETLKGKEIKLPDGIFFNDKDGTKRTDIRIKWWENPESLTYKNYSVENLEQLPNIPINISEISSNDHYREDQKNVFFGHYWLKGEPFILKDNVCCLDYSVAKKGKLVAYRFDDESLNNENLFFV